MKLLNILLFQELVTAEIKYEAKDFSASVAIMTSDLSSLAVGLQD